MKESQCDVLIIGAGPAGLMAGTALAQAGINVRVVDKRPLKVAAGQADGIQPRTIEVLQSYGLADSLFAQGNQMHMLAFYDPTPDGKGIQRTSRVPDVTAPTARYKFEITLHQGKIEAIFVASMKAHGLEVERPVIPVSLEISEDESVLQDPSAYPVKVTLKKVKSLEVTPAAAGVVSNVIQLETAETEGDGEIVHAKYVIGADGAHSWVRSTLGIKLDGEHSNHVWGVVDCVPDTDFPDIRNRCAIHSNNGSCMVIPREGDKVRLYVQLTEGLDIDASGRLDRSTVGPEKVMDVAKMSLKPFRIDFPQKPEWYTVYIIGQKVASKFSVKERVFIVGDACHTHSPKAGQGMNASINDSHNLSWKITQVLRGWASPLLLKTYEFERRKYAQDLINFDKQLADMFSGKAAIGDSEDGVTHDEFQQLLQSEGQFTSGIGVQYSPSVLVDTSLQSIAPSLIIGQRMRPQVIIRVADCRPFELHDLLVSDTKWKVLFFVGDPKVTEQARIVNSLAEHVQSPKSFLHRFTPEGAEKDAVFGMLTISSTPKDNADYTDIPPGLRTHWSKAFTDDLAADKKDGGTVYATYGVNPSKGAVVVVRPDGYVAYLCGLEDVAAGKVEQYFAGFMAT